MSDGDSEVGEGVVLGFDSESRRTLGERFERCCGLYGSGGDAGAE